MSNITLNGGNTEGNNGSVVSEYKAKDKHKLTVEFRGKTIECRVLWDSKKQALKEKLQSIDSQPAGYARNVSYVGLCLEALGLELSERPDRKVGTVKWTDNSGTVREEARIQVKLLRNGGQIRTERREDGTQVLSLDTVTEQTVLQCMKDARAWSQEDQAAYEQHKAIMERRKADRERHEAYEREHVHVFSCESAFAGVTLG